MEGNHCHVDEGLADLIWTCWSIGIVTGGSCQKDPGTGLAALGFAPGCAEHFVGAATDEDLDDPATFAALGWRMRGAETPTDWIWQPGDFGWDVTFAALFPPSDIPELVRRLGRWL